MDPALRLQPGQEELTPEQEAESERFAEESIRRQLSTEPVDEPEAEALLRQAYQVAGLAPPQRIQWLDGPLQFVEVLAPSSMGASVAETVLDRLWNSMWVSVDANVRRSVGNSVWKSVRGRVEASVLEQVGNSVRYSLWNTLQYRVGNSVQVCARAYEVASWLVFSQFFDVYLASNEMHALAHFNEQVSGYWLGQDVAVIVRRPKVLARDQDGRLHNTTGKCIEYQDGWGFYAWHGVCVPEQVILAPETLAREDFLDEANVEVRRIIQERMGERFVPELGGVVIDSGPQGTLYEVRLPEDEDDPEWVARYVQVQDASTERHYFLRVPPIIQTAAEAVAWTFQVAAEDYHPTQET